MRMTRYVLLAPFILIAFSLDPARAAKIEIPLPELSGSYPFERAMSVRFEHPAINIYGVSLRLQGYAQPGWWECDWGSIPIPLPKDMDFTATMPDSITGGFWQAKRLVTCPFDGPWGDYHFPPCEFDVTIAFVPVNGASWDFLKVGRPFIYLSGTPELVPGGLSCTSENPIARIHLATLVIDSDYLVGTRPSTWGRIKALFK